MDDIISLLKHYKIEVITSVYLEDTVYLERYGITIVYNKSDLYNKTPSVVAVDIIQKFVNHPDYKESARNYVKSLIKKPTPIELNITERKKLIREKLNIVNN